MSTFCRHLIDNAPDCGILLAFILRVLVSAFAPFGGRKRNTSADILRKLHHEKSLLRLITLKKVILPVNFDTAWPRLRVNLLRSQPKVAILMGEGKENAITLETAAHNIRRTHMGSGPIEKKFPGLIASDFAQRLANETRNSLNISVEAHPGDYLCNYIYFRCLREFPTLPTVFLHVKPLGESSLPAELEEIRQQTAVLISTAASVLSTS